MVLLFTNGSLYAQEHNYLLEAQQYLNKGECNKAQLCYEIYRALSDSINTNMEFQIDQCHNEVYVVNGVTFEMIYVRGGLFKIKDTITTTRTTSTRNNCYENFSITSIDTISKLVNYSVIIPDFYIGKYEVTQSLWKAVMGDSPSKFKGDDLPVENVSWDDCWLFIERLNQLTGKKFRIPTIDEWEFAAKGGNYSMEYKYSGSNQIDDVAWYDNNSNGTTHAVGTKLPNEIGIYDMTGNVFEFLFDRDYNGSKSDPLKTIDPMYWGFKLSTYSIMDKGFFMMMTGFTNHSKWDCGGLRLVCDIDK